VTRAIFSASGPRLSPFSSRKVAPIFGFARVSSDRPPAKIRVDVPAFDAKVRFGAEAMIDRRAKYGRDSEVSECVLHFRLLRYT